MEGDSYRISQIAQIVISIHSLRMEGDWSVVPLSPTVGYFNPLPPYGGRLATARNTAQHGYFNPLPPYGGRRPVRPSAISCTRFQSTPSVWRETYGRIDKAGCTEYFNPLPPYGGRQITHELTDIPPAFQSTPSVWRETQGKRFCA